MSALFGDFIVNSIRSLSAVLVAGLAGVAAHADPGSTGKDWPQWRGPLGSGVAPEGSPPAEWSEQKNIRWKIAIPGRAHAAPIVLGDRVYAQTAVAQGKPPAPEQGEGRRRPVKPTDPVKFSVLALDRKTGSTIWETTVSGQVPVEGTHPDATYASASPVTDGEHVFAYFGSYGLYCLDLAGKVVWEKDLGDMRTRNEFGEGSSPALFGDTLVVVWDHEGDDFIVALNKKTGEERWRFARDEPTTWATPLIVEVGGKPQVIVNAHNEARGYDLANGAVLWRTSGMTQNVVPSPVHHDGIVYLLSGFRGAAAQAIRLAEAKGDLKDSKAILWSYDKGTPYVPSPLLYKDCLYFLEGNKGVLTCLDARTGAVHYGPERLEGVQGVYASIVGAGGHVYIVSRDGKTLVLKAGPKFEVIATNTLDEGFEASPAIAGDEIFLRGRDHLYCIGAK